MDDLAHELPLNHRKRKASNDDSTSESQDVRARAASEALLVETPAAASSRPSVIAPRLPWLAAGAVWPAPTSPSSCSPVSPERDYDTYPENPPKRPRLNAVGPCTTNSRGLHRTSGQDVAASDIVPEKATLIDHVDYSSLHIPSLKPPINRQMLQELELDSIIQNPQLRHDLLLEPRLQFRPTYSRRKRDASEKYWAALLHELEHDCTCLTFDAEGKLRNRVCACALIPSSNNTPLGAFFKPSGAFTVRTPSRIRPFLCEFLEVLELVIRPLFDLTTLITDPDSLRAKTQQHSKQVLYVRSIFDPSLIEQEIKRDLFDPSGLLQAIGYVLKDHCAPMRDGAVDEMIETAKACTSGGRMSISDALAAFRMCMELFEIMKLDIANHQLQSLRPYLIRTCGPYELRTFRNRLHTDRGLGLKKSQIWLQKARTALLVQQQDKSPQSRPSEIRLFSELSTNQQIHLATLMGIVDLVFMPPIDLINEATSLPRSDRPPTAAYPETLYLDTKRLAALSLEAADITALYLLLLLSRQLAQAKSQTGTEVRLPGISCRRTLKEELRAITGNRLVYSFLGYTTTTQNTQDKRFDKYLNMRENITVQIVKHAHADDKIKRNDNLDSQLLGLARSWVALNFHPDSTVGALARDRLRNVVLDAVIRAVSPRLNTHARKFTGLPARFGADLVVRDAGIEPLVDELCVLGHKITRLVTVHLGTYLPLYEQDDFLSL